MTLQTKSGSVWRHSIISGHSYMQHSFWSSFSILGTNFLQTFSMPKSSMIIFQTLSSFMSSLLVIIQTVNWQLPYPLDIDSSPTCWMPPTSGVIFEPLVHDSIISIHLLKHFKCLWWSFPQPDKKNSGLFIAWCSLFISQCL